MTSIIKVDQIQKADGSTPTAGDLGLNTTGAVLQVVHQSADTSGNRVVNSSTSMVTAFSASITPQFSNSKILVMIQFGTTSNRNGDQLMTGHRVERVVGGTATQITSNKTGYSDDEGVTTHLRYINYPAAAQMTTMCSYILVDAPSTTSAVTYNLKHAQYGSNNHTATGGCYFTLMEIAG